MGAIAGCVFVCSMHACGATQRLPFAWVWRGSLSALAQVFAACRCALQRGPHALYVCQAVSCAGALAGCVWLSECAGWLRVCAGC